MGRKAPEVVVAPTAIAHIEKLVASLPSQARVRVTLRDGRVVSGTVAERPAAQLFEDYDGTAGVNSVLRLDDPGAPTWTVYLWLSEIARIESLDAA
jgi:hypothetical protein